MTAHTNPSPILDPAALAGLQAWQGRIETLADQIIAAPVRALAAMLDRDDPAPVPGEDPAAPVPAPKDAAFGRELTPDDVLLFRYSALTFNGHRIHYDRRYVTEVEGYPGLIVHGPLIATLLVDLLRREKPGASLAGFGFRALRPVFDGTRLRIRGRPGPDRHFNLWAEDSDGWLAMQASATLA